MSKKSLKKNKDVGTKPVKVKIHKEITIPWWVSLLLIISTCTFLYYPVINYGLVECDDHEIIHRDYDRIKQIENWHQEFFKSYMYNSYYRPIVTISFMLNAQMSKQEPVSYHLTNIVIHTINSILVFYIFYFFGYRRLIPLISGLIYSVHPLFTNAVAWIVGRNDLLLSLFFLIAFIFLILYSKKGNWYFLILHFLSFLFALFSKETAITSVLIFAAYVLIFEKIKYNDKKSLILASVWVIALAIWFIFHSMAELGEPVYKTGFDVFLFNLRVIPEFVAKFILPVHLSVLATYSLFNTVLGILLILFISLAIIRIKTLNKRIILFGFIWFLVVIVPGMYMTLLNSYQWNDYLECRGYLAMIGILIVLFEILKPFYDKYSGRFLFISVAVFIILAYLTSEEENNYKDAPSYYESAVNDDPTRSTFQYLAGQVFINNLYKKTNQPEYLLKAEKFLKAAMELRPNYAMYYRSMAAVYTYMSKHEIALSLLEKSLALDSNQMDTYNGLGYTYYYLKRFDDEVKVLTAALKKWPENQNIIYNLAVAYFALYNSDSALSLVKYSYKLDKSEKNKYELYYLLNEWGGTFIQNKYYEQGVGVLRYATDFEPKRYAAYENLMNYYLIVYNRPDSAAYFAKKLIERRRPIDKKKLEFLKPYMK